MLKMMIIVVSMMIRVDPGPSGSGREAVKTVVLTWHFLTRRTTTLLPTLVGHISLGKLNISPI